jgi:hypothetical protein
MLEKIANKSEKLRCSEKKKEKLNPWRQMGIETTPGKHFLRSHPLYLNVSVIT